jgi:hypothetical protein
VWSGAIAAHSRLMVTCRASECRHHGLAVTANLALEKVRHRRDVSEHAFCRRVWTAITLVSGLLQVPSMLRCEVQSRRRFAARPRRFIAVSVMLGVGLFVVPSMFQPRRMHCCFPASKEDDAKMTARKYAYEAYPCWVSAHPDRTCPGSLLELNEWMNNKDIRDVWGNDYVMVCGEKGIVVVSPGKDGALGTADDITSLDRDWNKPRSCPW